MVEVCGSDKRSSLLLRRCYGIWILEAITNCICCSSFNETEIQRFKNEASKQKQKAKQQPFYKQKIFF